MVMGTMKVNMKAKDGDANDLFRLMCWYVTPHSNYDCVKRSTNERREKHRPATAGNRSSRDVLNNHLNYMAADEKMMRTKRMKKTTRTRRMMHDEADDEDGEETKIIN